jgi:hypothetical protein
MSNPGRFKTLSGWVQTCIPVLPALGAVPLPIIGTLSKKLPIIWPPLGSIEFFAASSATILVWVFGEKVPSLITTQAKRKAYAFASLILAVLSLLGYVILLSRFVPKVDTPFDGVQYRSIGYERTAAAKKLFPESSDEEILKEAGMTDADIKQMWTPESVDNIRILLFCSYATLLATLNVLVGSPKRSKK